MFLNGWYRYSFFKFLYKRLVQRNIEHNTKLELITINFTPYQCGETTSRAVWRQPHTGMFFDICIFNILISSLFLKCTKYRKPRSLRIYMQIFSQFLQFFIKKREKRDKTRKGVYETRHKALFMLYLSSRNIAEMKTVMNKNVKIAKPNFPSTKCE